MTELLNAGVDLEVRDVNAWTALMRAAFKNHTEIVSMLIDRGASVEASSDEGETPLLCAADGGGVDAAALLLDRART